MKFIELTLPNGHAAIYNVAHIVFITPMIHGNGKTALALTGGAVERVTESAKEILAMINDDNG